MAILFYLKSVVQYFMSINNVGDELDINDDGDKLIL